MTYVKALEDEVSTWPHVSVHSHRFGGVNSSSTRQKLVTCIQEGSLTYPFRAQYAMHCWQTVLRRSITGFRTQVGPFFMSAAKKT